MCSTIVIKAESGVKERKEPMVGFIESFAYVRLDCNKVNMQKAISN